MLPQSEEALGLEETSLAVSLAWERRCITVREALMLLQQVLTGEGANAVLGIAGE